MADQPHPVRVTRCGDHVLIEITAGAALLSVAEVERLHTDLERAASTLTSERRAAGR